ncbi:hypothetical protein [Streptomyces pseudovenezuelae]|uniref:Intracellular protease/amidase n=1 Tax=Streptomyces pseudovenezuelae TaxID=67350 RepID=A0ABT6LNZ7_9ACTN|nr:hypothetical protein [Streptomyces pseudovenezuelae]MDH6218047.1 putative intracellular protease/amidase [Streptomyces pseudovenezuelae]
MPAGSSPKRERQYELLVPLRRLREEGADVTVAAATADPVQTLVGDKDLGETVEPDATFDAIDKALIGS